MTNDWCPENDLVWQKEQAEIRALAPIEENGKLRIENQRLRKALNNCIRAIQSEIVNNPQVPLTDTIITAELEARDALREEF